MQKLFIPLLCIASLSVGGCSSLEGMGSAFDDMGSILPDALNDTSLIYRPEVQQGNVVSQEMIDKLKPGMSRRQVTYILGTPLLVDAFHQDRWDYIYTRETGGGAGNKERISLFFEDDTLIRVEGDFRPETKTDPLAGGEETVFSVPDYGTKEKGFFTRTLETMGIDTDEKESTPSAAGMGKDDKLPEMDKEEGELPQTVEDVQVDNTPKPEQEEEEKGFFSRTLEAIGL